MNIEILKNKNQEDFYPLGHTKAIYNDDGELLDDKLKEYISCAEDSEVVGLPICEDLPFRFGIDEDGNYGYYKVGADTVTPFKSSKEFKGSIDLNGNINLNESKIILKNYLTVTDIDIDYSKSWEYKIVFKPNFTTQKNYHLFGANTRFYAPALYFWSESSYGIDVLYSSNGTSWSVDNVIPFRFKEIMSNDKYYEVVYGWDTNNLYFSLKELDGETLISKSYEITSPQYHPNNSNIIIGSNYYASNNYCSNFEIDMNNLYIKQEDDIIWGYVN